MRAFPETKWLLPIGVVRPSDNPEAATDHWCAQAFALGMPLGSALCLDVEQYDVAAAISARWPSRFYAQCRKRGYRPTVYTSGSSIAAVLREAPMLDGQIWGASWKSHEHALPHCFATQWHGGVGVAFDQSTVVDDAMPLWENRGGVAHPLPPLPGGLVMPFVKLMPTKSGAGYWIVGADGGVESFGDADFHGSMGGKHITAPVTDGAVTPTGNGYWLLGGDGAVYAFGDADFYGRSPAHAH